MPIDDAERARIVEAIRRFIARERISRAEFAERTRLGKSTVDKLLVGIFSEKTILQVEARLSISLRSTQDGAEFAREEFGKYTREDTRNYVGEYVFARPSFRARGPIHAFRMEIVWDGEEKGLLVKESAPRSREEAQFGRIHIPRASMHIFILSNERGWLKSVILSQIDIYKRMKGMMLTMGNAFANIYSPVAMPVIMNKYDRIDDAMVGEILPGTPFYEEYNRDLLAVERGQYGKWVRLDET
jgi:hypothetical protein